MKCQADIYFTFFSKRYGDKDLELSYLIASYCVQNLTEYIDMIETSDTQTQTAGQAADYATLHLSIRSQEVSRDHVKIEKIIDKGTFGQLAKVTAVNPGRRPGKTTTATKMLKGKLYLFAKES